MRSNLIVKGDMDNSAKIDQLISRNVSDLIVKSELVEKLNCGKSLRVYLGVDPSSPDIHLGHAVVLWKLKEFQDLGHKVILLIGDFTAQIGDPTGKSKERIPLTHDQVLANAKNYKEQVSKIIKFDGENPAELKFNSAWLNNLNFAEVISLASNFTVQQLIERDMFQERLKNGQPIGLHEFLYPLMVGYDCVELDVDVEVGGNDQLFNIRAGRTLMEKLTGKKKVVMVCDLLTGSDGAKMSKSSGNIISLNSGEDDMFGKVMALDDRLIQEYARLCTDMTDGELDMLKERLNSNENPRDIKLDLAERIVARYYDSKHARETWKSQDKSTLAEEVKVGESELTLVNLVARAAALSMTESRRLVADGAIELDGVGMSKPDELITINDSKLLKVGKRRLYRVSRG